MKSKLQKGFTLLEIVIVLALLAFLTINVAVAIRNGFRARTKIQEQVRDMSQVRDALRVIERDINLAFHYRDLEQEFRDELKKASGSMAVVPGAPPPPPDAKEAMRLANRKDPVTHFVGDDHEVSFATLNSGRMSANLKQADFIKVGYSLKPCRDPASDKQTQCLVRRESPLVEGDITRGGVEVVLLRDVTEFKLRYFGRGKQDWSNDWNSVSGDGVTKNAYPQEVEISLTIERGEKDKKKKISMQTVALVRFPNNDEKAQSQFSQGGPTQ